MEFKTFAAMNIAIIGNSEAGMMYARGFALAGHNIYIAWENDSKAVDNGRQDFLGNIEICGIETAASIADLIIIATQPKDVREAAYWLGDVRGKVIVDCSANVQTPEKEIVNTYNAIRSITGSPHVVKVFNTRGYEQIIRPLFDYNSVEMLLAGESKKAKEIIKIMALELGITKWYDFGNAETLPLFNQMAKVIISLSAAQKQKRTTKMKSVK